MEKFEKSPNTSVPLGIYGHHSHIYLYSRKDYDRKATLQFEASFDGAEFTDRGAFAIIDRHKSPISSQNIEILRISKLHDKYFLTYKRRYRNHVALCGAVSHDLVHWQHKARIGKVSEIGMVVSDFDFQGKRVLFFGEKSIRIAYSQNLRDWEIDPAVLHPHQDFYGTWPLTVASVLLTAEGILLLYYVTLGKRNFRRYQLKAALFDREEPSRQIKKYTEPIWESPPQWVKETVHPVGVIEQGGQLLSFWWVKGIDLVAVYHPLYRERIERRPTLPAFIFQKLHHNPILGPVVSHFWESRATFNPAAFYADDRIHLVYRAIGDQDVSVLGYAESRDGLHIDVRHPEPIFVPSQPFEVSGQFPESHVSAYASGGGVFGGCEDPRITKIDDTLYMTYVAHDGTSPPRVAFTAISERDFLNKDWNWKTPVLISAPGVVDKNACIMPEKINGKYVIFHRIFPNILVDFVDSLDFDGTTFLKGEYKIEPRPHHWDSRKLGAGPPPIKTPDGWLLIYQAVDDRNDRQYQIGAMLLDLDDPTRVLQRSSQPIIEPTHWYENVGHKAGVAYPCGAVTIDDKLIVYYGGADMVVCAATAPLSEFLAHLKTDKAADLRELVLVMRN